ncbi:MAG: flagellar FliJ family protein [Syntrophorhabdaceae bacterium]|nr:flagellar FliJ family protein [Syntrophorhabdaceae bacterium]
MVKFGLDRVIEIKERLMDDRKTEMERVISEMERVGLEIVEVDRRIIEEYTKIGEGLLESNEFYVIKEHTIYLENVKQGLKRKNEELAKRKEKIRSEMLSLLKELKMLETLKKKALREKKRIENRKEQKRLDELALRIDENR